MVDSSMPTNVIMLALMDYMVMHILLLANHVMNNVEDVLDQILINAIHVKMDYSNGEPNV